MTGPSIQESLFPELTCFGCGPANPKGLRLRSFREGDLTVAEFEPWPEHDNGFGFLNGGIISTILDCHGAATVMSEAARQGWTEPDGSLAPFVTATFDVKFRRPTPRFGVVRLQASPESVSESQMVVRSEIVVDDKTTATMTSTWARFRTR